MLVLLLWVGDFVLGGLTCVERELCAKDLNKCLLSLFLSSQKGKKNLLRSLQWERQPWYKEGHLCHLHTTWVACGRVLHIF